MRIRNRRPFQIANAFDLSLSRNFRLGRRFRRFLRRKQDGKCEHLSIARMNANLAIKDFASGIIVTGWRAESKIENANSSSSSTSGTVVTGLLLRRKQDRKCEHLLPFRLGHGCQTGLPRKQDSKCEYGLNFSIARHGGGGIRTIANFFSFRQLFRFSPHFSPFILFILLS